MKQSVVQEALAVNQGLIQQGPLQALQAVGGLELAAMTGAYLEAARRGMPVMMDGYISGARGRMWRLCCPARHDDHAMFGLRLRQTCRSAWARLAVGWVVGWGHGAAAATS